jgi:hypothetical protein
MALYIAFKHRRLQAEGIDSQAALAVTSVDDLKQMGVKPAHARLIKHVGKGDGSAPGSPVRGGGQLGSPGVWETGVTDQVPPWFTPESGGEAGESDTHQTKACGVM